MSNAKKSFYHARCNDKQRAKRREQAQAHAFDNALSFASSMRALHDEVKREMSALAASQTRFAD